MKRIAASAGAGGIIGGAVVWLMQRGSFSLSPAGMTFEQLAALLLAFASFLVTVLGVGVAVLALWGYAQFKGLVDEAAQKAAVKKVDEELKEGELRRHTELVVTTFLQKGLADGSLVALLESRKEESERLSEVDKGWGEVTESNSDGK
jgi:hypothetical protein